MRRQPHRRSAAARARERLRYILKLTEAIKNPEAAIAAGRTSSLFKETGITERCNDMQLHILADSGPSFIDQSEKAQFSQELVEVARLNRALRSTIQIDAHTNAIVCLV